MRLADETVLQSRLRGTPLYRDRLESRQREVAALAVMLRRLARGMIVRYYEWGGNQH
ncbi:MAG: hypothetical protein MPN21_26080 [Thermoanaerobaculia bacterium]|nr:hypothetical protein [Thermoanaerobaculia bacterium]